MKHVYALLAALLLAAPSQAQTLKSLMVNTSNGVVAYSQALQFQDDVSALAFDVSSGSNSVRVDSQGLLFGGSAAATTRTNLGLGANSVVQFDQVFATDTVEVGSSTNTIQITTEEINFGNAGIAATTRTNLGLGELDNVRFADIFGDNIEAGSGTNSVAFGASGIDFTGVAAANTRSSLGLGATNAVVFGRLVAGATNQPQNNFGPIVAQNGSGEELQINSGGFTFYQGTNAGGYLAAEERLLGGGDWGVAASLTINQTTATNGLLYIYRTNSEAFLGLANLIASNNTTVSNETLFRVGVAEATNRSAQFGFRSTNTNGNGVAVFSVFGYNALMMIGPSDPNAGTNPIQATVYSINPTNKVMTLITTNTGAMQMHRPIGIDTAGVLTNAPSSTNAPAGWIQFYVGTNSVRVPYYQ
jgi:hypothetical protein